LPSEGPPWISATRPTSTSLHDDALISASPIMIDSEFDRLADVVGACDRVERTHWASCRGFVVVMKLRWFFDFRFVGLKILGFR
jgi:hypothetical protein